MTKRDPALDLYNSFKGKKRTFFQPIKENGSETKQENREKNKEPLPVGELINELVQDRQWQGGLAEGEIFIKWPEIVGTEIALHSEPIEIKNGKLFIKCSSTAWATQLNLVKSELLISVKKVAPGISELEIYGPSAPSWRKGLRTIQGSNGPRDTYG
jgi:predicted nucleic acid-binding Zn ribbon protein